MTGHRGFTSVFAAELDAYVTFKENMGFTGASRVWYLKRFDAYCGRHELTVFDRDTVEGWVTSPIERSGRYRSWMSYIRDFGRWLRTNGVDDAYVLSDRWKAPFVPAHPYLLTRREIDAFFTGAAALDVQSPSRWQAVAFFLLMHSCGLRTGEARALRTEQVDLHAGHIDIVWSKGNRSRRLPLTGQVVDVLCACDRTSHKHFPTRRSFFVSARGNQVTAAAVGTMFGRIWDQAWLPRSTGGQQPRPYDFRHHFAYACIERDEATQGRRRDAALPISLHGPRDHRIHLLLHPHLARLHGRLRPVHPGRRGAAAGGRIRMRRDPRTDAPDLFSFARDYLHTYMPRVRGLSPKTIQAYRISLECFLDFLAESEHVRRDHVTFDHFDRPHLKAWLTWMTEQRHYAPKTVTLRLSAVKAFLAYASAEDITLVALCQASKALKAPRTPRAPIEYLVEPETRALLAAFTGQTSKSRRNRMLLILLYDTAARVGEITDLTLQDIRLTRPGHVTLTGKRNKTRIVPLTAKTADHLRVYLAEFHPNDSTLPANRPLFYSLHHSTPTELSVDTISAVLKQAARTARRQCPSVPTHIHCHMLRKTKAMDLYQQGVPLPIIMRLLGHENTSTTAAFYAFATMDMMREAINAATPAINDPPTAPLTDDQLETLYSLK